MKRARTIVFWAHLAASAGPARGVPDQGREGSRQVGLPNNLAVLWARAEQMVPTWGTMSMRFGSRPDAPVSFSITDAAYWNAFARSNLTLDGRTAEIARWEPYTASSPGQKLRGWIRFAHTGELGGVIAQTVAGLASAGGACLVWTGLSLALRRFIAWRTASPRARARAAQATRRQHR